MTVRRPAAIGRNIAAAVVAALVGSMILTPTAGHAVPGQEEPGAGEADSGAVLDIDVEVAEADTSVVAGTLEEIQANVANQLSQLQAARTAVADAEAAVASADAAVEATEAEIDVLVVQSDAVVVEAFILPPATGAVEALASESVGDATLRQALLDMQADDDADVLAQLDDAREELENRKEVQDIAVADADAARVEAEAALADLEAATSQQAEFLGQVNQRMEQGLAEAAALQATDPDLAAQLAGMHTELATKLQEILDAEEYADALEALAEAERQQAEAAAAAPPAPVTLGPASGGLSESPCPGGGSITVDSTLAGSLTSMLNAAAADGINLCGTGYRSPEAQIEVRKSNCGTSYYAIYEAPASSCSPPTARPGTSMHEQGLAIDFTCNGDTISSRSSSCFQWLDANAAGYGLYNLPDEPWHFSTTGS